MSVVGGFSWSAQRAAALLNAEFTLSLFRNNILSSTKE
jgi:hypothetical protein